MKSFLFAAAICAASLAGVAEAQAPAASNQRPTPEAVRAFWSFYFDGQGGGPVLADAKLCLDIHREGEHRFECSKLVPDAGIKAGTRVILWQAYLLPRGEVVDDLRVQVKEGDTIRETKDVKLKGESIRTRNLTTIYIPKAGTWTLRLLRGDQELRSFTFKAW